MTNQQRTCEIPFLVLLALVASLGLTGAARGGGGAENVFLLVNPESEDSMTVANHYIDLRKLPSVNVFYLSWRPERKTASGKQFRENILLPTLAEIEKRGLAGQIDYLVYSCDFPYRVNFAPSWPDEKFPPQLRPLASLTGATYLSTFVEAERKELINLRTNFYATAPQAGITVSRGFRSSYYWSPDGKRHSKATEGLAYRLSTMLGVTYERGEQGRRDCPLLATGIRRRRHAPRRDFLLHEERLRPTVDGAAQCFSGNRRRVTLDWHEGGNPRWQAAAKQRRCARLEPPALHISTGTVAAAESWRGPFATT